MSPALPENGASAATEAGQEAQLAALYDRLREENPELLVRGLHALAAGQDPTKTWTTPVSNQAETPETETLTYDPAASSGEKPTVPLKGAGPLMRSHQGNSRYLETDSICGPFRVLRKLGQGGMGVVYLAARIDFPDQQVALKTLFSWDPKALSRFQKECRILSGLKHPNIAHLIDAGVMPNGQPWLAMEYVAGETMDVWLRHNDPDLETRLNLFLKVCDAVSHAHQQMVIHRDLKPGNIMIQPNTQPKILDFGIAVSLDADTGEQIDLTARTQMIMTPQYASPEQFQGLRLNATSDVYSLGVVLYELLVGKPPYLFQSSNPFDIYQVVREAVVTRPSKSVGQDGTTTLRFSQQLRGDLDIITLKALERSVSRRYASVEALASDLRLYQKGMPIAARPATSPYRLRKFLKRNPWPVSVAVGLIGFTLLFAGYAQHQGALVTRQRDLAESRLKTSQRMTQFLVSMFDQVDPDMSPNREVSALEIMENGRRQIETGLDDDPQVQALLLATMGRVYRSLGHYEQSRGLLAAAVHKGEGEQRFLSRLSLVRTLQRAGDFEAARNQLRLAEEHFGQNSDLLSQIRLNHSRGKMLFLRGRYQEAAGAYSQATQHMTLLPAAERSQLLRDLTDLRLELGDYDQAVREQLEQLALRRELFGEEHSQVAETLADLGAAYLEKDDNEQAEQFMDRAESMYRRLFGDRHPHIVNCLLRRGDLARLKGDQAAATAFLQEAETLARDLLGERHPLTGNVISKIAILHRNKGEYDLSEKRFKEVLRIRRDNLGEKHPYVAFCLDSLGYLQLDMDHLDAAEATIRLALSIKLNALGEKHPAVADSLEALSQVFATKGELDQAEPLLREALAVKIQAFGEKHRTVATMRNNLASLLQDRGDYDAAEPLYRQALAGIRENLGDSHLYVAIFESNLAGVLKLQGHLAEAEMLYHKTLAFMRREMGEDHPYVPHSMVNVAKVAHARGRYAEAEALYREAFGKFNQQLGADHTLTAVCSGNLGDLLVEIGSYTEAETLLEKASAVLGEKYAATHPRVRDTHLRIAELLHHRGDLIGAEKVLRNLVRGGEAEAPAKGKELAGTYGALTALFLDQKRLDDAASWLEHAETAAQSQNNPLLSQKIAFLRGRLLRLRGQYPQAETQLRRVLEDRGALLSENDPFVGWVQLELAELLSASGRAQQAPALLEQAKRALAALPAEHEIHQVVLSLEGGVFRQMNQNEQARTMTETAYKALARRLGETHHLTQAAKARRL